MPEADIGAQLNVFNVTNMPFGNLGDFIIGQADLD